MDRFRAIFLFRVGPRPGQIQVRRLAIPVDIHEVKKPLVREARGIFFVPEVRVRGMSDEVGTVFFERRADRVGRKAVHGEAVDNLMAGRSACLAWPGPQPDKEQRGERSTS